MARTTANLVKDALGPNYDNAAEPSLTTFIAAANNIVSRANTCATARGYTLTSSELQLMETFLAAWNYTQQDPLYSSRSTAGASGSFRDQDYKALAISQDPSGCLAGLLSGNRAGAAWLGTKPRLARSHYEDA